MTIGRLAAALLLTAAIFPEKSGAQPIQQPAPQGFGYADLADLASTAPVVADAEIRSAIRLKGAQAAGVPAGKARLYVEADVRALIRGASGSPARINYVAELPLDARGKLPKLKRQRVLLLARPVQGKPGSLQLVAPDAQIPWNQATETRLRAILTELVAPGATPRITGVRSAFHVPGTIPGEGETQIFLATETGNPISLSILRRPGEIARWAVATGEIIDESAGVPKRDTLLWYRLACSLPPQLPAGAIDPGEPANAAQARADYRVVIDGLGPCGRTRAAQTPQRPVPATPRPVQPAPRPR